MGSVEINPIDNFDEMEADAARWRAFLEENLDALLEGVPKRPDGWWQQQPGEDAIAWMFRMFR
jgi:hypothetical protein